MPKKRTAERHLEFLEADQWIARGGDDDAELVVRHSSISAVKFGDQGELFHHICWRPARWLSRDDLKGNPFCLIGQPPPFSSDVAIRLRGVDIVGAFRTHFGFLGLQSKLFSFAGHY